MHFGVSTASIQALLDCVVLSMRHASLLLMPSKLLTFQRKYDHSQVLHASLEAFTLLDSLSQAC